jgi:hypothetical protein
MRIAQSMAVSALVAASLLVLGRAALTQAQGVGAQPDLDTIKRDYRRPAPRPI